MYYVYKILADEAELLAETPEQHEKVSLLRRLADQTLVDRSKPTEFVGGFTRNLDKNDNYKLDELEK